MLYKEYIPPLPLQQDIKCLWILETTGQGTYQRILPDGCAELILYRTPSLLTRRAHNNTTSHNGTVIGQASKYIQVKGSEAVGMVGARFYPWGLYNWCRMPMHEFTDQSIPIPEVFGLKGEVLQAEIARAASNEEAIRLLAGFLVNNRNTRAGTTLANEITKEIINYKGRIKIAELSANYRYSKRYVEKIFKEKVGIHPKLFSRITLLQHTLKELVNCSPARLTRLAYQSDYFDQSHFIRDFKDLAGITPREYLAENHQLSDLLTDS